MDIEALLQRFHALPLPRHADAVSIESLLGNAFIGVHSEGAPCLFFELNSSDLDTSRRLTRGLDLIVSPAFAVTSASDPDPSPRAGYALLLRDRAYMWCFSVLAAQVGIALARDPTCMATRERIEAHVSEWSDFFGQEHLSAERAVGLWGELYLMTQFTSADRAVVAWVGPARQMCDFLGSGMKLEVKTSVGGSVVWFNLDQIEGKESSHSIFVRVLPDRVRGRSLDDLVNEIARRLRDRAEFDWALVKCGYVPGANRDLKLVADEMHGIPNSEIPRPRKDDSRIRSVRYALDIEGLATHFVAVAPLIAAIERTSRRSRKKS